MSRSRWRRRAAGAVPVVVIVAFLVPAADPAQAATLTVTTTTDVVDAGDGVTSLREAFIAANALPGPDTIQLAAASYVLADCGAGALTMTGTAELTIEGGGATVTQTCDATGVFAQEQNVAAFTLRHLTIHGGTNAAHVPVVGAAVAGRSPLVLTDVTISGVDAGPGGSVVAFDWGDAAVHDAELHQVTISGNVGNAVDNITNSSGLLVDDSVIEANSGGGISLGDGSPLDIVGTEIIDNGGQGVSTTGQGNGLQPMITVTASTISGNGRGGLSCRGGCRTLTMTNSVVTGNGAAAAPGDGGGIEFATYQPAPTPTISIAGSTVTGNTAQHDGGGLWVHGIVEDVPQPADAVQIVLTGTTMSDNHADCAGCRGGGVAALVGSVTIQASTLADNTAASSGGAVFQSRAASDAASAQAEFHITGSLATGNAAGGSGGALHTDAVVQEVAGSRISGNSAGSAGGAMVTSTVDPVGAPSVLMITGSTFDGNSAFAGGAVNAFAGADAQIVNSTFTANSASGAGGALITSLLGRAHLTHVTLVENSSPVGANVAGAGPIDVARSVIAEPLGGGTNCAATLGDDLLGASGGFSWFDDASCHPSGADTVAPGTDPQLGPLADNGGPTPTRLPAVGSPVAGLIPVVSCTVAVDQRGAPRPAGGACDAGAVEITEAAPAVITGTPGHDVLVGTAGDDHIEGLGGPDLLVGGGGADLLVGGAGRDLLFGGPGDDTLRGGPGNDILVGGSGNDVLDGGPGHDLCIDPGHPTPWDC